MAGKEILLLGNPLLRKSSLAVQEEEFPNVSLWERDLKETLEEFRNPLMAKEGHCGASDWADEEGYLLGLA